MLARTEVGVGAAGQQYAGCPSVGKEQRWEATVRQLVQGEATAQQPVQLLGLPLAGQPPCQVSAALTEHQLGLGTGSPEPLGALR